MRNYFLFITFCLFLNCFVIAQIPDSKSLRVGDKVPEITLNQLFNYKTRTGHLKQFEKELLILDFWSTSCKSCIVQFRHMQSLQEKFGERISILLVNGKTSIWKDDEIKAARVLNTIMMTEGIKVSLPIIFNSKKLDELFPWQTIPHLVWIRQGKVIAITGAEEVTADNIGAILNGESATLRKKNDLLYDFSTTTLTDIIYRSSTSQINAIQSSTLVRGYIDGLNNHNGRVRSLADEQKYIRWYTANESLVSLYRYAYQNDIDFPVDNRVLIEVSNDSLKWKVYNPGDPGFYENVFSYDIMAPATSIEELLRSAQHSLNFAFGTKVEMMEKKIRCYIITCDSSLSSSKSEVPVWRLQGGNKQIRAYSPKDIIFNLNVYSPVPLVDETNTKIKVDVNLPQNVRDEKKLMDALRRAGFIITEGFRDMRVIVIRGK